MRRTDRSGGWMQVLAVATLALACVAPPAARAELDAGTLRRELVLAEEPANALPLAAARGKLGLEPKPIVVVGRIGGKGVDPFLEGKASFSLVEIPADDHAKKPGHDADNCPFCKKRQANATMAAVQFLGADGKPIPLDARGLFNVAAGRDVVIRGSGVFDPKLGVPIIQVTAEAIFVRPAE
jgi:hypothetical protein